VGQIRPVNPPVPLRPLAVSLRARETHAPHRQRAAEEAGACDRALHLRRRGPREEFVAEAQAAGLQSLKVGTTYYAYAHHLLQISKPTPTGRGAGAARSGDAGGDDGATAPWRIQAPRMLFFRLSFLEVSGIL